MFLDLPWYDPPTLIISIVCPLRTKPNLKFSEPFLCPVLIDDNFFYFALKHRTRKVVSNEEETRDKAATAAHCLNSEVK